MENNIAPKPQSASDVIKTNRLKKKKRVLGFVALVLIVIGAGAYALYDRNKSIRTDQDSSPAVVLDQVEPLPDFNKVTQELEAKYAATPGTRDEYRQLAQLYLRMGNRSKALETYKLARQKAHPGEPDYQVFINGVDESIRDIEARP